MVYFISDPHFGHDNIIRHCNRPFRDAREMDDALLSAWHAALTPEDDLYILGDLMYYTKTPQRYLDAVAGPRLHLVLGNHDPVWMSKVENWESHFVEAAPMLTIILDGRELLLCHDPEEALPLLKPDQTLVYGHIHNDTSGPAWEALLPLGDRALNAGVEVNNYRPVTFAQMLENNRLFHIDHA